MKNTVKEHVKGKRPTATSASPRRVKADEHPPKRTRKCPAQYEPKATEPKHEHREAEHQDDLKAMYKANLPNDLLYDEELMEGMMLRVRFSVRLSEIHLKVMRSLTCFPGGVR
jgi:hypothetical protein